VRTAAAVLAAALLLAAGAGAEVRRFEVVGAVPVDPAKPPAAPRQAALRAALVEAVSLAARNLVADATGKEPGPEEPPIVLEGEPSEYAVSYRVLEDRGLQDRVSDDATRPAGREYAVVAEVQIDLDRVRERLRANGQLAADPEAAASAGPFRLEILEVPSPAVWTAVRTALIRAGARSVLPLELEAGRALVEVDAPVPADRVLERALPAELPDGLGLESLPAEGDHRRVRVRPVPPPSPEAPAEAPTEPPAEAPPAPAESPSGPPSD
jgi:hypothetical protein